MSSIRIGVRARGQSWLWVFPDTLVSFGYEARTGSLPYHLAEGWTGPRPDVLGSIASVEALPTGLAAMVDIDSPTEARVTVDGVEQQAGAARFAPTAPKRHPVLGILSQWKTLATVEVREKRARSAVLQSRIPPAVLLEWLADPVTADLELLEIEGSRAGGDEAADAFARGGVRPQLRVLRWPMLTSPTKAAVLFGATPALGRLRAARVTNPLPVTLKELHVDALDEPVDVAGLRSLRIASDDVNARYGVDMPRCARSAVASACWTSLESFTLHGADDASVAILAEAPVPTGLRALGLPDGSWGDATAERLGAALARWPAFETLDVDNGQLSLPGMRALFSVTTVRPGVQRPRDVASLDSGMFFGISWEAKEGLTVGWIRRIAAGLAEVLEACGHPRASDLRALERKPSLRRAQTALTAVGKDIYKATDVDPGLVALVRNVHGSVARAAADFAGETSDFWGLTSLGTAVVLVAGTRGLLGPGRPVAVVYDPEEAARVYAEVEALA